MALDKKKFEKYLKLENNTIIAKTKAVVNLDLTEYKNIEEEFSDDNTNITEEIDNTNGIYNIPGYFSIYFPDEADSISFFLPYNVSLLEHDYESNEKTSTKLSFNYEPGDKIFFAKFKQKQIDIRIVDKLFENGIKYLSNDLNLLINNIWSQINMAGFNIGYHNIETILVNLYLKKIDKKYIPVRLTPEQEYKKEYAVNTKESAHLLNNNLSFLYGYTNDSLISSVTSNEKFNNDSFFEKIVNGKFIDDEKSESDEKINKK